MMKGQAGKWPILHASKKKLFYYLNDLEHWFENTPRFEVFVFFFFFRRVSGQFQYVITLECSNENKKYIYLQKGNIIVLSIFFLEYKKHNKYPFKLQIEQRKKLLLLICN